MIKKITLLSTTIVLLAILIVSCAQPAQPAQQPASQPAAQTFRWKYINAVPAAAPHVNVTVFLPHIANIEKRSNGRLKIDWVNWAETPYKGSDALRVARDGLSQGCEVLFGYVTGDAPMLGGPELQYMAPEKMDLNQLYSLYGKMWSNPKVKADVLDKVMNDFNSVSLGIYHWGPQPFWLTKEVKKPTDLKGMQIREFSSEGADMLKALGASATLITAAEVYTALQRGMCDGLIAAPQAMLAGKWYEVIKYGYLSNTRITANSFTINKKAWDSLPPDLQKIMSEEIAAACKELNVANIDDSLNLYNTFKTKMGFTLNEDTPEDYQYIRNLCKENVWPNWLKRVGPQGKDVLNRCFEAMGASERF